MPAVRQLARPASTISTGVAPLSSEAKIFGMVGVEGELALVLLLGAEAVEAFDGGAAVRAVHPLARRAPLELGGLGCLGQRFARAEQCLDVDAVVDGLVGLRGRHGFVLGKVQGAKSLARGERLMLMPVGLNRLVQARLPERAEQLDLRAAVHDDLQARRLGQPGGLVVAHADLRPQHLGADRDGLACDLEQRFGAAEHLHHVHRPVDRASDS